MQGRTLKETSQLPAFRLRLAGQMADYRQRLADQVRHEREKKSLSRDALALASDVSAKTIKRIEDQEVDNPRPVTIRRIAEALGIEPSRLRPPPELEADQLHRIEAKLDRLLVAAGLDGGVDDEADAPIRAAEEVALGEAEPMPSERARPGRSAAERREAS